MGKRRFQRRLRRRRRRSRQNQPRSRERRSHTRGEQQRSLNRKKTVWRARADVERIEIDPRSWANICDCLGTNRRRRMGDYATYCCAFIPIFGALSFGVTRDKNEAGRMRRYNVHFEAICTFSCPTQAKLN